MLLGWRDPVERIFEIRGPDGDGIVLLNLLDDLEYRTYSIYLSHTPTSGHCLIKNS